MMQPGSRQENEIKLRIPSAAEGKRLLREAGFRTVLRRTFEDNWVFDTPDRLLRSRNCLVRVRMSGNQAILTYKGPPARSRHKVREEIETAVSDPESLRVILERLGYEPVFRYQKFRTEYAVAGEHWAATLDETPIGCFLELEGAPAWIDKTAARLGFAERDYVLASYGTLYLDFCRDRELTPGHMVFPVSKRTPTIWRT